MFERKPKKDKGVSYIFFFYFYFFKIVIFNFLNKFQKDDYWDEAKILLSNPNKFIISMEQYKRDSIKEIII